MLISKDELPIVLEPPHIQKNLGIGRRATYEFLNEPPFTARRVGKNRMIKVSKEIFFVWLEGEKKQG
ncbi:DNA-binding protein [Paenibacillus sp. L3-i20]|uniref:DNA-binding protein n=1 Tax=Paenibacillus sp. L3-i20 TaxID=2905833 RepID=UPI001EE00554|nr:DNA-binding protein [Paenibacillus sp. L3-i20]GKU79596.1 hypothetical protein L3i20_v239930 [Paenibacillus sp. L3-i20]